MAGPRSAGSLLAEAEARLAGCGIDASRLDAEVLLAHALGVDRGALAGLLVAGKGLRGDGPFIEEPTAARFREMIERRALREPVAYITGTKEFWSLELEVTPDVLIPRPETELLVEETLAVVSPGAPAGRRPRAPLIVDVGTGSGAVAVALAVERPGALVLAIDRSEPALRVARRNARRHGAHARIALVQGDLLEPLREGPVTACDAVVSNPPYVGHQEREGLMPDVRDYEPAEALFSGPTGMEAIERLVPGAARILAPGGWLLLEVAAGRAAETRKLLEESGSWRDIVVRDDYAGIPRVVRARLADERA